MMLSFDHGTPSRYIFSAKILCFALMHLFSCLSSESLQVLYSVLTHFKSLTWKNNFEKGKQELLVVAASGWHIWPCLITDSVI